MKLKTIIINNVAASSGGALTILEQFLGELINNKLAKKYIWIIFVSNNLVDKFNAEHVKIIKVNAKRWDRRILWDTFNIKKWLIKHKIHPVLAISLMSVGIKYLTIKQIVYIHHPLPFSDYTGYKWFELNNRLYSWLFLKWMRYSINSKSLIVVQTDWMKKRVYEKLNINNNQLFIFKPNVCWGNIATLENTLHEPSDKFSFKLFYPVVPTVSYKNFELLLQTIAKIKERNPALGLKIELIITCTQKETNKLIKYYYRLAQSLGVYKNINWVGYCDKKQIYCLYMLCDALVFPSKVETFGLPLIEAASFGKKIFAINKPYVKDVLGNYSGLEEINNDSNLWSAAICKFYSDQKIGYEKINPENSDWSKMINFIDSKI